MITMEEELHSIGETKYKIEERLFQRQFATFCTLASVTGTIYATKRFFGLPLDASEISLTTAAVGVAVSTVCFVGSVAWMLYERNRHKKYKQRSSSCLPYVMMRTNSDIDVANLEDAVDRLDKAIPECNSSQGEAASKLKNAADGSNVNGTYEQRSSSCLPYVVMLTNSEIDALNLEEAVDRLDKAIPECSASPGEAASKLKNPADGRF